MRIFLLTTALLLSSTSLQALAATFPFVGRFGKGDTDCTEIKTVENFDIDKYIEFTWYIQRQQVNSYQPAENLFCVTATYRDGKKQWGKPAIAVSNYANEGGVNLGKSGDGGVLCATTPNENEPAKLGVAPCFLPPFLAGDYWVAAVGDNYEWAIVTGGQPTIKGECSDDDLCTTPESATNGFLGNGEGLWFFTREQAENADTLAEMEAAALELGICTANMVDVVHEGCNYDGSDHKNP